MLLETLNDIRLESLLETLALSPFGEALPPVPVPVPVEVAVPPSFEKLSELDNDDVPLREADHDTSSVMVTVGDRIRLRA